MATFKALVLRHQMRKDGTFPVLVRVGKGGKSVYIRTEYVATFEQLRKKDLEIKDFDLKHRTNELIKRYNSALLQIDYETLEQMSVEEIRRFLNVGAREIDFISEFEQFVLAKTNEGTRSFYRILLRKVIEVNGSRRMPIVSFNSTFVSRLSSSYVATNRYINGQLCALSTVFRWIKSKYNTEYVQTIRHNPFYNYKPKQVGLPLRNRDLSNADFVACMEELRGINERVYDFCVISFLLCGINFADLWEMKPSQLCGGRICYKRKKTRNRRADESLMSVRVEPELLPLIEKYRSEERLFDFGYKSIKSALSMLSQVLRKVGSNYFCFYTVRHKWANIARVDCGISDGDIDFCLCHVGVSRLADVYTGKTFDIIDRCNRMVIDRFNELIKEKGAVR